MEDLLFVTTKLQVAGVSTPIDASIQIQISLTISPLALVPNGRFNVTPLPGLPARFWSHLSEILVGHSIIRRFRYFVYNPSYVKLTFTHMGDFSKGPCHTREGNFLFIYYFMVKRKRHQGSDGNTHHQPN